MRHPIVGQQTLAFTFPTRQKCQRSSLWPLIVVHLAAACSGGAESDASASKSRSSDPTLESQLLQEPGAPPSAEMPSAASLPGATNTSKYTAADPAEGLFGRIISSSSTGTLCPHNPYDQDLDGVVDNIHYGDDFVLFFLESKMTTDAMYASCTITTDIEVPEGYEMGLPVVAWRGAVGAGESPLQITRSTSFEGSEAHVSTRSFSDGVGEPFSLVDENLQVFSACGQQLVRVTATLEVQRGGTSASLYDLESVSVNTSWRKGTAFKSACSADPIAATSGQVGEWCGGQTQRPCESGLVCEYPLYETAKEGECVDPSAVPTEAAETEACGGVQNIPCAAGLVCWRDDASTETDQGVCFANPSTRENTPCDTGWPALQCGGTFTCSRNTCLDLSGAIQDPCGQGEPECRAGLYCAPSDNSNAGICTPWAGQAGAPCGTEQFPTCSSTGQCVDGRCVDLRGSLNRPCGEYGCRSDLTCIEGLCKPRSASTDVTTSDGSSADYSSSLEFTQ